MIIILVIVMILLIIVITIIIATVLTFQVNRLTVVFDRRIIWPTIGNGGVMILKT